MEEVPEELARWAVGPGLVVIDEVTAELREGADLLAVGSRLRRQHSSDRASFATVAATSRLRALEIGVEGAEQLVLTSESLEQASHAAAARWRAARAAATGAVLHDAVVQDRCAGTGGDAVELARHGPVLAIEADPGRAVLAAHRATVLGRPVTVRVGDALDPAIGCRGALVHADPDRRDRRGRRARRLAAHRPAVGDLLAATTAAAGRLLTVAPGVAWDDPALPPDAEVVFLQHGRQLLEAVLCTGVARDGATRATAVLLDTGDQRQQHDPEGRQRLEVGGVGAYLLRPAPALVRARLHDAAGGELGARRVAARRALLTADREPAPTPWFDVEAVLGTTAPRPTAVQPLLPGDARVEIVLHGLDADVSGWWRALGGPPRGPDDVRVHLVRRDDDAVAVVTRAVPPR